MFIYSNFQEWQGQGQPISLGFFFFYVDNKCWGSTCTTIGVHKWSNGHIFVIYIYIYIYIYKKKKLNSRHSGKHSTWWCWATLISWLRKTSKQRAITFWPARQWTLVSSRYGFHCHKFYCCTSMDTQHLLILKKPKTIMFLSSIFCLSHNLFLDVNLVSYKYVTSLNYWILKYSCIFL